MSTIVAFKSPCGGSWIGADTQATSEHFIWPERIVKWVPAGRWRVGCAGNGKTPQLVRDGYHVLKELHDPGDVAAWLVELLAVSGYRNVRKDDEPGAPNYGQDLLLASADGVWSIDGDGLITEPSWGFFAAGSGSDYAYGAAHAMRGSGGEAMVRAALEAAAAFDTGTGGDLIVERVE